MNAKEMGDRISLENVMKHTYFEGIDFDNLPTYQQAASEVTPFERVVTEICDYLIQTYASVVKESTENREKIYKNDIVPYIQKSLLKCPEEMVEISKKLVEVIEAQTSVMINLSDDLNVSFAELYRTLRNIEAPVIENPINENEE